MPLRHIGVLRGLEARSDNSPGPSPPCVFPVILCVLKLSEGKPGDALGPSRSLHILLSPLKLGMCCTMIVTSQCPHQEWHMPPRYSTPQTYIIYIYSGKTPNMIRQMMHITYHITSQSESLCLSLYSEVLSSFSVKLFYYKSFLLFPLRDHRFITAWWY